MLKFYFNGSPNPTKVALFLEEAGIAYQPVAVDTRKGEQFTPEYLAINPNAKVPAIDDDGVFVARAPHAGGGATHAGGGGGGGFGGCLGHV